MKSTIGHDPLPASVQYEVGRRSTDAQMAQAARALADGTGAVVFDQDIALHTTPAGIRCEVFDRTPAARRCAFESEVLLENAQRALTTSAFFALLPEVPLEWRVIECDPPDAD